VTDKNIFRFMVALSLALMLAAVLAGFFPPELPEQWESILEWNGDGGITEALIDSVPEDGPYAALALAPLIGIFLMSLLFQIGLFFFWRFARFGYVILVGFYVALGAFDGLYIATPLEQALFELTSLVDGAIIAMAYLPPVRDYFEAKAA
jgi:hypothetical protein